MKKRFSKKSMTRLFFLSCKGKGEREKKKLYNFMNFINFCLYAPH